jgi:hypothetical protein
MVLVFLLAWFRGGCGALTLVDPWFNKYLPCTSSFIFLLHLTCCLNLCAQTDVRTFPALFTYFSGAVVKPGAAVNRDLGKKKWKKDKREDDGERRTSLRVGTGKKGRAAEASQRRGSLKKRDRSMQKAIRAEAAIERKTVNLPEYVQGFKSTLQTFFS